MDEQLEKAQKALMGTIRSVAEQAKGYIVQAGKDLFEGNDQGAALELNLATMLLDAVIQTLQKLE